jgi:hypothetical protein
VGVTIGTGDATYNMPTKQKKTKKGEECVMQPFIQAKKKQPFGRV